MNEEIKARIKYILQLLSDGESMQAAFALGKLSVMIEQLQREEKTPVKVGEVVIEPLPTWFVKDNAIFFRTTEREITNWVKISERSGDFFREVKHEQ